MCAKVYGKMCVLLKTDSLCCHRPDLLNASIHFSLQALTLLLFFVVAWSSPLTAGMCLRAWATSGHSPSTSATCRMTRRTSASSRRRGASRRFLSKVDDSLRLSDERFSQGWTVFCSDAQTLSVGRPDGVFCLLTHL